MVRPVENVKRLRPAPPTDETDDLMGSPMFADRVRAQLRTEVLDAAAANIAVNGWPSLRMQAIADAVGVSRRTLYNEFGSKPQLAQALVTRSVEHLGEVVGAAIERAEDLPSAWLDGALVALEHADADPVIVAVRTETAGPDFLPLLTSAGDRSMTYLTERLVLALRTRWPSLAERESRLASHAAVRLIISYFLRSPAGHRMAAQEISEVLAGYLEPVLAGNAALIES
jgi:AcrR family transcriptional regulator